MFFHHPISGTAWILQPSDPRTVVLGQIGQLDRANAARKVLAVGNQDVECPGDVQIVCEACRVRAVASDAAFRTRFDEISTWSPFAVVEIVKAILDDRVASIQELVGSGCGVSDQRSTVDGVVLAALYDV